MASRLAEIYRREKSTGGGLGSAVGKRLKEKIDPRQALDQSGLLVSMFPSLKTYKATKNKVSSPKISSDIVGSGIDNDILNSISATSSLTAKNSMSLPMMARDMNLMKLNIFKLVKLQGGSANTNKTDIFWNNAKARESSYENTISKITGGGMIGKMAKSSFTGRQKRDGQSPDSALFVTGGAGGGFQASEVAEGILTAGVLKKIMTSTVGFMTSPVGLSILGVAAGGVAIAALARKVQDDQIDKAAERGDVKAVEDQIRNQTLGGESALYLSPEDSVGLNEAVKDLSEDRVNKVKKPTKLEIEAQAASERLKNLPDTGAGGGRGFINPNMPTGAGGGRGFVNPTLVTPEAEPVPSNVVRTASGDAIRSGSGGYVTSGTQTPAPAAPIPMPVAPSGGKPPSPTPTGRNALLDVIAKGESESSGGYNAMNQGTIDPKTGKSSANGKVIGSGDSQKIIRKKLTDMTVGEIMSLDATKEKDGKKRQEKGLIFAAGRYQIIPGTLATLVKAGVVSKDDKFDEKTQDKLGNALIETRLKGIKKTDYVNVQNALAKEWASIPLASSINGRQAGESYYGGPGNKAHKGLDIKTALMQTSPSTGSAVASASTSVADGKMAAMVPTGGNTVINNKPVSVASASPSSGGKPGSTYDNELFQTLLGYQSSTA